MKFLVIFSSLCLIVHASGKLLKMLMFYCVLKKKAKQKMHAKLQLHKFFKTPIVTKH